MFYFTRPSVKRDLSSSLYIAVSLTDVALSFAQIPVIVSLIASRDEALFSITAICTGWRIVFKSLQRFSVFLVLLLSVSRTVSLVQPLSKVNRICALRVMYGYIGYIILETAIFGSMEGYSYDRTGGYCYENGKEPTSTFYNSLYVITLGVPALATFISFILSTLAIRKSMRCSRTLSCGGLNQARGSRDSIKKQATNTIMIFTFTYIICNLPHFINMIMWIITMSLDCEGSCYPGPLYDNDFMYWFSWNISEVLSVIINMACNPVIYYLRISQYKQWVTETSVLRKVNRFLH